MNHFTALTAGIAVLLASEFRVAAQEPPLRLGAPAGLLEENEPNLLSDVQQQRAVQEQAFVSLVHESLREAGRDLRQGQNVAPRLERLLEQVLASARLQPETRSRLRNRLQAAIVQARRQAVEAEAARELAESREAALAEKRRILAAARRGDDKVDALMDRFHQLMAEADSDPALYDRADLQVAREVEQLRPDLAAAEAAKWQARFQKQVAGMEEVRDQRHKNFAETLRQVEKSAVPFAAERTIKYPPRAVWDDLTRKRMKYKSMNLAREDKPALERIYRALDEPSQLQFVDLPLEDAAQRLSDLYDIPIVVDLRALDDMAISSEAPVTVNLKGVSLKAGLRLMLRDLDLTYIVQDEVLQITTADVAANNLTTRVYPVGDLVLPIISGGGFGGGNFGGGQGMGGIGMGGQGMGQGMGRGFGGGFGQGLGGGLNPAWGGMRGPGRGFGF